jgi:hypothetical protein
VLDTETFTAEQAARIHLDQEVLSSQRVVGVHGFT